MRILMLTPALPWPPHQGGALRHYGQLHGLRHAGHRITLLGIGETPEADSPLHDLCERVVTAPPPQRGAGQRLRDAFSSRTPDLALRLDSDLLRQRLDKLLDEQEFDLVHFGGLEICALLPVVRRARPGLPCCYDALNAEYRLQESLYAVERRYPRRWPAALWSWFQARRIARYEARICQLATCTLAVSGEDAEALQQLVPGLEVHVVPNGIFVSDYDAPAERRNDMPTLTFTGKMDYRPNVDAMLWFCDRVLPQVQQDRPCRLNIVGQAPSARLLQLGSRENVHVTGRVDSIQPWLHNCDLYVVPLRMGSGTRLKILEAMACGCAIVATSLAAAGLPPAVRQTLCLADDEESMAGTILQLLDDPGRRRQLGLAARAVVRETSDWSAIMPQLLSAWERCGL